MVSFHPEPPRLVITGDEDRTTQGRRRRALSRALQSPDGLLVDLSGLSFADPSLIVDLAMIARRLRRAGRTMRLTGAQPQIRTLIERVGLHRLHGVVLVVETPAAAPAAA